MRRLVIIGTAAAVLAGAAAAYAAFNSYTGSGYVFTPGAGTKAHPVTMGRVENLQVSAPAGQRAAVLTDIVERIYGVRFNGGAFPKCTDHQILANKTKYDKACASGSRIGSGPNHAVLGPGSNSSSSVSIPCNTTLHIYNAGANRIASFFTTHGPNDCGGLTTGGAAPYDATISYQGNWAVIHTPLPPDISTQVANHTNLYGSLVHATYSFPRMTRKSHGKTVGFMQSVGCQHGTRPWSIKFTAHNYDGSTDVQTVSGSSKC